MITVIDKKSKTAIEADPLPSPSNSSPRKSTNLSLCNQKNTEGELPGNDGIIGITGRKDENKDATTLNNKTSKKGHPPPITDVRKEKTSDLMSRLRTFLPQMESANHALLRPSESIGSVAGPVGSDRIRLDAELKLDEGSDSESDHDSQDAENRPLIEEVGVVNPENEMVNEITRDVSNPPNDRKVGPTIQLEFTLGDMSSNPLMKLLANDDDDDANSDRSCESITGKNDEPLIAARRETVENLLLPLAESQDSDHGIDKRMRNDNLLLFNSVKNGDVGGSSNKGSGKKRLITELS